MVEILTRRAVTSTDGTAIIATDTPVERRDQRGPYLEILDPAGAEWPESVPLLDTHQKGTVKAMLGRGTGMRREGNTILADLTFSDADDVAPVRQRWADRTIQHFSAGYQVLEWAESVENGQRVKRAVRWRLVEISLVANPADPNARRRALENEELTRDELVTQIRAALALPDTWGDDLPEDATAETIRAAAREAVQTRQAPRIRVGRDHTDPAAIMAHKVNALAYRMAGGDLPEASREFVSMTARDLAADSLIRAGEPTKGLSATELFTRAGQHTTSDFPLLVSNAMNKVVMDSYQAAESPLKVVSRPRTLSTFKESSSIRIGEIGAFPLMTESGEFTASTRAESGEVMQLASYGTRLDVSHRLLIDDDMNALGDMVAALGQGGAQTEAKVMVDLVTGNPLMRDGVTVFNASRGNVSTPAALSVASLGAARLAMRQRKGLDGVTPISATPAYVLVGPELETLAEQVLSAIYAADVADVNPFANKLRLLVEPRITGNDWWVFADPARLATLQHAYLSGAQGVQIQRQEAWNIRGLSFRAFLDFGAGWVDWRGAQYNAGA